MTSGSSPAELTNVGGTLFFQARAGASGFELWRRDGTRAGTVLVKDINPGPGRSFPVEFCNVVGTLFLSADDGRSGAELWQSDGSRAETALV